MFLEEENSVMMTIYRSININRSSQVIFIIHQRTCRRASKHASKASIMGGSHGLPGDLFFPGDPALVAATAYNGGGGGAGGGGHYPYQPFQRISQSHSSGVIGQGARQSRRKSTAKSNPTTPNGITSGKG